MSAEQRADALARAHVWRPPAVPIEQVALDRNPPGPGAFREEDEVDCTFVPRIVGGTTSKFYCALTNGDTVKVKYGASEPELPAEVAATRLMRALGFEADRMYVVRSVRCAGCPPFPFQALQCFERTGAPVCLRGAGGRAVIFTSAVIERPAPGRPIQASHGQGWAWYELDMVDPRRGGATRAELDALRLMAVVLAHWDNKSENQRLICPPESERRDGTCAAPVAMIQDLGATFGPLKLDLDRWKRTPVWADARECRVSLKALPYGGGTFPDAVISEDGRRFALRLLEPLSPGQLDALFVSAGVARFDHPGESGDPRAWTGTFLDKVRAIADAGPCPTRGAIPAPPAAR